MRCLVVEDDPDIQADIRRALEAAGFVVDVAGDGEAAWYGGDTGDYDAAVLDLGLPRLDGLRVLARTRTRGNRVPVLVLTARDAVDDRVKGLDAGADDYVVKPVDLDELAARLRALVRRSRGEPSPVLAIADLMIDPAARTVHYRGAAVELQAKEFNLLHEFALNAGRVLSREQIQQRLYAWGEEVESNTVDVHIHHLRRKLAPELIRTVRGVGYVMPKGQGGA